MHCIVFESFRGKMVMILCVAFEMSGGQVILKQRLPQPQHKLIAIFFVSRGLYEFAFQWNMPIKSSSPVCLVIHRQLLPFQGISNNMFAWYFVKGYCRLLRKSSPKNGRNQSLISMMMQRCQNFLEPQTALQHFPNRR